MARGKHRALELKAREEGSRIRGMWMKWNENERGPPFYKTVGQLKGSQKPISHRNEFRHYCKIRACTNFEPVERHQIYKN